MKDYRKEEAAFFDAIQKDLSQKGILGFVDDGIVDTKYWNEAKAKCLFLLKEPVGKADAHFSLTAFCVKVLKETLIKPGKTWQDGFTVFSVQKSTFPIKR